LDLDECERRDTLPDATVDVVNNQCMLEQDEGIGGSDDTLTLASTRHINNTPTLPLLLRAHSYLDQLLSYITITLANHSA
jgi:hypothetical protein